MRRIKNRTIVSLFLFTSFLVVFATLAFGEAIQASHVSGAVSPSPSILSGTDSKGSFSYDQTKPEGSKGNASSTEGYAHGKKEGSGGKGYSGKGHGYGKYAGSRAKKYSEGSSGYGHHGKGKGYGKYGYFGHGGFHGKGMNPFRHVLMFKKRLGLTEDQIRQIKDQEFEYKKMKIQTEAEHQIAHMELDRLVHSENIDEPRIRALADKISDIKSRQIHATIDAKLAVLKTLTPAQRKLVSDLHSRRN